MTDLDPALYAIIRAEMERTDIPNRDRFVNVTRMVQDALDAKDDAHEALLAAAQAVLASGRESAIQRPEYETFYELSRCVYNALAADHLGESESTKAKLSTPHMGAFLCPFCEEPAIDHTPSEWGSCMAAEAGEVTR